MRQFQILTSLIFVISALGCGGDEPKAFIETIYQLRCPSDLAGCSRDGQQVDIFGYDSEPNDDLGSPAGDVSLTCSYVTSGTSRTLAFDVRVGSGASAPRLRITGALVNEAAGGSVGGGCQVMLIDDSNTYAAACSGSAPSAEVPCQLGPVSLMDGEFGPEISTTLLCTNITAATNPLQLRRNLEHGAGSPLRTPAALRLINCDGT